MHYTIILASFVLCATSVDIVGGFRLKLCAVSKVNEVDKHGKDNTVGHKYSCGTIKRHKRSTWTSFIEHFFTAVKPLRMEPLLVEGANGVDDFGRKFKSKFRDSIKSKNAMLSEGIGNGGKTDKTVNTNTKELEPTESEEMDYKSLMDKKTKEKVAEVKVRTANREKKFIKDDAILGLIKDEIMYMLQMNKRCKDYEKNLIRYFLDRKLDAFISMDDTFYLLSVGMTDKKCNLMIEGILASNPELEGKLEKHFPKIKRMRDGLHLAERMFARHVLPLISKEQFKRHSLNNLLGRLNLMRRENDYWLNYPFVRKYSMPLSTLKPIKHSFRKLKFIVTEPPRVKVNKKNKK